MTKIGFLALLLIGHAGSVWASDDQPNIVLILSDDQGWADIGYNNDRVYSPNLDKLAAGGVVFTQHYVMPQCTPTRVALMTGRYPSRFGGAAMAASNAPAFPKGTPTMASMLKSAGYQTFLCGKWHLGSNMNHGPNQFGFDHSYGSMSGAVGMYNHKYRKGKFERTWHRDLKFIEGDENGKHATDLVTDEAVRIIQRKHTRPFFLYVPFHSVHTPLDERGPFVDRPTQLDPKNKKRWLDEDKIKWFNDPAGRIQSEKDPEKRLFLASVYHLDDAIGRIVQALNKAGIRKNTLILFSSDNGPQVSWGGKAYPDDLRLTNFNQTLPFRGKKVDVWEGGIHVPGLANWPGKLKPGKFQQPTHIVDWFPTLAALGRAKSDQVQRDGVNLTGALFEGKKLADRSLYWTWSSRINRWAVRHGDWKIVKYGAGQPKSPADWQLFQLKNDPAEKSNIAGQHPDQLKEMHQRFLRLRADDRKPRKPNRRKKKK